MFLLDFETRSFKPIDRGHDRYFQDPDADILCLVYGHIDARKPNRWWPGCGWGLEDLFAHVNAGGNVGASNAAFDQAAWEYLGTEFYEFPLMAANQWYCTQAQMRAAGLPSKLEHSAQALGQRYQKSRRGAQLIREMCIPPFEHTPELLAEMVQYCVSDWYTMREGVKRTPALSPAMIEAYHVNETINNRGVRIDIPLARAAFTYAQQERAEISERIHKVTCGAVEKPTQHTRFKNWLKDCLEDDGQHEAVKLMVRYKKKRGAPRGEKPEKKYSSDKVVRGNIQLAAEHLGLADDILEALKLMDDAGGSATSKFNRMARLSGDDGRVRGSIRFWGASTTGRYSSLGLQLHNFRRDAFSMAHVRHYRRQILRGQTLTDPETGNPSRVMDVLGKLLRAAIIPKKGYVFVVGDWSAVESRMTAWLARDQRKLNVFERGECPYEYAASAVYGRPISKKDDPEERQVGKVLDLACGFIGGPGALAAMASNHGIYLDEDRRIELVDTWRAQHPRIVNYSNLLASAAMSAMRDPGEWISADRLSYRFHETALYCLLPDGETLLRYPEARVEMLPVPWDENTLRPQITALKAAYTKAADEDEWPRNSLWRGLLIQNPVQASCAIRLRDLVDEYQDSCIFHVHDEIILEVRESEAEAVKRRLKVSMERPIPWAKGLPLHAEPVIMERYGK